MGRPTELEMDTSEPSVATEFSRVRQDKWAIVFDIRVLKRWFRKKNY